MPDDDQPIFARRARAPYGQVTDINVCIFASAVLVFFGAVGVWNLTDSIAQAAEAGPLTLSADLVAAVMCLLVILSAVYLIWYFLRPRSPTHARRAKLFAAMFLLLTLVVMIRDAVYMANLAIDETPPCVAWPLFMSPVAAVVYGVYVKRRAERPWAETDSHWLCGRCGYDLAGTPDFRCPECGAQNRLDEY